MYGSTQPSATSKTLDSLRAELLDRPYKAILLDSLLTPFWPNAGFEAFGADAVVNENRPDRQKVCNWIEQLMIEGRRNSLKKLRIMYAEYEAMIVNEFGGHISSIDRLRYQEVEDLLAIFDAFENCIRSLEYERMKTPAELVLHDYLERKYARNQENMDRCTAAHSREYYSDYYQSLQHDGCTIFVGLNSFSFHDKFTHEFEELVFNYFMGDSSIIETNLSDEKLAAIFFLQGKYFKGIEPKRMEELLIYNVKNSNNTLFLEIALRYQRTYYSPRLQTHLIDYFWDTYFVNYSDIGTDGNMYSISQHVDRLLRRQEDVEKSALKIIKSYQATGELSPNVVIYHKQIAPVIDEIFKIINTANDILQDLTNSKPDSSN